MSGKSNIRALVCGGRDFADYGLVYFYLDTLEAKQCVACVIEGGAQGADHFARQWATQSGKELKTFAADWGAHGKAAGPLRNQRMLDEGKPDVVLAFPGGRGTADMVRRARAAGVRVIEVPST